MDQVAQVQARIPPFGNTLGIRVLEVSPERLTAEMTIRDDLCTTFSVAHGGALMAFADTLGAVATTINLPEGAGTTTVESKTNFFRPAMAGSTVRGTCTPLHRGRRLQTWQTHITDDQDRLVALITQTQIVLEGGR
jgi:1,4-dihydroxy-2-naphthoyl-CoA hydrolase